MPTVDIPNPINRGAPSGGIGGIPTPLLLIAVGGGIGLIVFLTKKSGTPTDKSTQNGTLLPNTAIMLGSLQQSLLETEGKVTTGNADLSNQLSGVGSNLGLQIDSQSAQVAQSFSDLSTFLTKSSGTLQGQQDALASAIAGIGTQNVTLADSLTSVLKGITAVNSDIQTQQGTMAGIVSAQNAQTSTINSLGQQVSGLGKGDLTPYLAYEGKLFRGNGGTNPTSLTYTVLGGKLYGIGSYSTFLKLAGVSGPIDTNILQQQGKYTTIATSDNEIQKSMSGMLA